VYNAASFMIDGVALRGYASHRYGMRKMLYRYAWRLTLPCLLAIASRAVIEPGMNADSQYPIPDGDERRSDQLSHRLIYLAHLRVVLALRLRDALTYSYSETRTANSIVNWEVLVGGTSRAECLLYYRESLSRCPGYRSHSRHSTNASLCSIQQSFATYFSIPAGIPLKPIYW
jgi:hypothetical protein